MERIVFFREYRRIGKEIKETVSMHVKARVYIFGSAVRGDYSVGLSDLDVAIVSDEFKNRDKRLKVYDILFSKYFKTPIEFHLLTNEQWKFYLRFIGKEYEEI